MEEEENYTNWQAQYEAGAEQIHAALEGATSPVTDEMMLSECLDVLEEFIGGEEFFPG